MSALGESTLQMPEAARDVCRRLRSSGHEAYVVGGCVRDVLLGVPPKDWDVATSAHPEEVLSIFPRAIPTGIAHGTVTVMAGGEPIEVTTFRGEGAYSDSRRPDYVTFGVTLEEDLSRRDFTVNAMALDPAGGKLVDPFGGQADLAARLLKAVGEPSARFGEDGLRVMRAVRLVAALEFQLEPATEAAIPGALGALGRVSAERVRDELMKLLAAPRPSTGLRVAERTGVLRAVLPELDPAVGLAQNRYHAFDVWEHTLATVDATRGDAILRLAALLHDVGKPATAAPRPDAEGENTFYCHDAVGAKLAEEIARRLRLSNRDRERLVAIVAHHMFWYAAEWTDATVRRFLRRVGTELVPDLFELRRADVIGRGRGEEPDVETHELARRIEEVVAADQALSIRDLTIGGADLIAMAGRPPGPWIGEVLRALLERVTDEPSLNEREALLELAAKLVRAEQ